MYIHVVWVIIALKILGGGCFIVVDTLEHVLKFCSLISFLFNM